MVVVVTIIYAFAVYFLRDLSFFYTNDDVLLDQITSGRISGIQSPVTSFISQILGTFMSIIYMIFPNNISFFGLFQIMVGYLIIVSILILIYKTSNHFSKILGIVILLMITPQFILAPTFTITAAISTCLGVVGLTYIFLQRADISIFLIFLNLYIIGYIFRPLSFALVNLIMVPGIFIFLYSKRLYFRIDKVKIILTFTVVSLIILIDKAIYYYRQTTAGIKEYWDIQSSIINFNPAALVLQQKIISGDAMQNIWSNVDYIILSNWAYVNKQVFSIENFQYSLTFVNDWIGLRGFLNSDPKLVISDFYDLFLSQIQLLFLIIFIILVASYFKELKEIKYVFFLQFFINFFVLYYLGSTLRIPDRLFYSFLVVILLTIFLFSLINVPKIDTKIKLNVLIISLILILPFHMTDIFGINNLFKSNQSKLEFQVLRKSEINNFSNSGIFIGPISYFPDNYQNAIKVDVVNNSLSKRTILLSWANFSPNWNKQLENNFLDKSNLLNSLAKKKNVYWISNSYLAEILNYHMNDHEIYRGKLCSLMKLNGNDNAEIFTYQAKESDC